MKRLFDIFLSSIGLIGSAPLWLIFSLAIKLEDRGPVFYMQERVGKNGRIFKSLKFRSMIPDAGSMHNLAHFRRGNGVKRRRGESKRLCYNI